MARIVGAVLLTALFATPAGAQALDTRLYGELLARHTRPVRDSAGVRVDYASLRADADWPRLIASLAGARAADLATRSERLAFWINAYNVLAIDVVLRHDPVESIKDVGGWLTPVWRLPAGRAGGRAVTLHEVEHEILRPLGEPRIHAAIVCASTSCPSLRREPFSAEALDAQLEAGMRAFLADPRKGLAVDRGAGVLRLSKIFDWFEEDFASQGGVRRYVTSRAPDDERAWLEPRARDVRLEWLDYDWSLNDLARAPSGG
jgi:hypothetical protein